MKKMLAFAAMILMALLVIFFSRFSAVYVFSEEGYLLSDTEIGKNLEKETPDASGERIEPVKVKAAESLYTQAGSYYVGEGKKEGVTIRYPMFLNEGTAFQTWDDKSWLIDADFHAYQSFPYMVVSDGQVYNTDRELLDQMRYSWLRTSDGQLINARLLTVETVLHEYEIPMNSFVGLFEDAIRYYSFEDGSFVWHAITDVDYTSGVTIDGKSMTYYDLLLGLGKIQTEDEDFPIVEEEEEETEEDALTGDRNRPRPGTAAQGEASSAETGKDTSSGSEKDSGQDKDGSGKEDSEDGKDQEEEEDGDSSGENDEEDPDGDREENENQGDRPPKPQPDEEAPGEGEGGEGGEGGESGGGEGEEIPWQEPKVSCGEFTPGVYRMSGTLTIDDPAKTLVNGVSFRIYRDGKLYMRKNFYTSADPAVLGGLMPGKEYRVEGVYTYRDENGRVLDEVKFFEQTLTLKDVSSLAPLGLSLEQGDYGYNQVSFKNMKLTEEGDGASETLAGLRAMEIILESGTEKKVMTVTNTYLQKFQAGDTVALWRSDRTLSPNKEWKVSYKCYDIFRSELPIKALIGPNSENTTVTTKQPPEAELRVGDVAIGSAELEIRLKRDRDGIGTKNLRVELYSLETGDLLDTQYAQGDGKERTVSFTGLPAGQNCRAVLVCDGVLYDGWAEGKIELDRISFSTTPLYALGAVNTTVSVAYDETDVTKVGLKIRMKNSTNERLFDFIESIRYEIAEKDTGKTAAVVTLSKDDPDFDAFLRNSKTIEKTVQGLKGRTAYTITPSSVLLFGGEKYTDIETTSSLKEFTTFKEAPLPQVRGVFTNGDYLTFEVMTRDLQNVIEGDTVKVQIRRTSGNKQLIFREDIPLTRGSEDIWTTVNITRNVEAGASYDIEFYAEAYNQGVDTTTLKSGVFYRQELKNTRYVYGNFYLHDLTASAGGYTANTVIDLYNDAASTAVYRDYYIEIWKENEKGELTLDGRKNDTMPGNATYITGEEKAIGLKGDSVYQLRLYSAIPGHPILIGQLDIATDSPIIPIADEEDLINVRDNLNGRYVAISDITTDRTDVWYDALTEKDMKYYNVNVLEDRFGTYFDFNGVNSYIDVGGVYNTLDFDSGFTIEVSLRTDTDKSSRLLDFMTGSGTSDTNALRLNTSSDRKFVLFNKWETASAHDARVIEENLTAGARSDYKIVYLGADSKEIIFYKLSGDGSWAETGRSTLTKRPNINWGSCRIGADANQTYSFPNNIQNAFDGGLYRLKISTSLGTETEDDDVVVLDLDPDGRAEETKEAVKLDCYENVTLQTDGDGNAYYSFPGTNSYIEVPLIPAEEELSKGFTLEMEASVAEFKVYARIFDFAKTYNQYNIVSSGRDGYYMNSISHSKDGITSPIETRFDKNEKVRFRFVYTGVTDDPAEKNFKAYRYQAPQGGSAEDWTPVGEVHSVKEAIGIVDPDTGAVTDVERASNFIGKSNANQNDPNFRGRIYSLTLKDHEGNIIYSLDADRDKAEGIPEKVQEADSYRKKHVRYTVFNGSIDFQGFTLTRTKGGALLPSVEKSGEISNLVYRSGNGQEEPSSKTGTLVNRNNGTLKNIIVYHQGTTAQPHRNVTALCCDNWGTIENFAIILEKPVYADMNLGMACVRNYGTVKNGYLTQSPEASMEYAIDVESVAVSEKGVGKSVGGIVGYNNTQGSVTNVYSTVSMRAGGSKGYYGGLLVGQNLNEARYGYASGSVSKVFPNNGPAIAYAGGNAANYPELSGFSFMTSEKKGSAYNNPSNREVYVTSLFDEDWQNEQLNGEGQFEVGTYLDLGYYPHVKMTEYMPDQPLIPLPGTGYNVSVTDCEVVEYLSSDSAIVKFKVYNPSVNKPTVERIDMQYLTVLVETEMQEDPLGDFSYVYANVKVDPEAGTTGFGMFLDEYTVTGVKVSSQSVESDTKNTVKLKFWKDIKCASGDSDGDGVTDGWAETVVLHGDQNYKVVNDIDFGGTAADRIVVDRQLKGEIIGEKEGGKRPTLSNMDLGGRNYLFRWVTSSNPKGSVTYGTSIENLDFDNVTLGGEGVEYAALINQLSGEIKGVSLRNSTVSGYRYVGGLVKECQTKGVIRDSSVTDSAIAYYDSSAYTGEHALGGIAAQVQLGELTSGGTIENCFVRGIRITQDDNYSVQGGVGGIVGLFHGGTLKNCYADGEIDVFSDNVGGIAGAVRVPTGSTYGITFTMENLYSRVDITVDGSYVGGIAGRIVSGSSCTFRNALVLGDIESKAAAAVATNAAVGYTTMTGGLKDKNVCASDAVYYSGRAYEEYQNIGDFVKDVTFIPAADFLDASVYDRVQLGSAFTGAGENLLPKLLSSDGSQVLPWQEDLAAVRERPVVVKNVTADGVNGLIFELHHEEDMTITGLDFDYLETSKPAITNRTPGVTLIRYGIDRENSRAMDVYHVLRASYTTAGSEGEQKSRCYYTLDFTELFGSGLYKVIHNSAEWHSYMTANMRDRVYENYKVAAGADISMKGYSNVPYNLYINRLIGEADENGVYPVIRDMAFDFTAADSQMGSSLILKERGEVSGLTFQNIYIRGNTSFSTDSTVLGSPMGIIGTSYGKLENLHFEDVAVTSANHKGFDGCIGFKRAGTLKNCTLKNVYINYENIYEDGQVRYEEGASAPGSWGTEAMGRVGGLVGYSSSEKTDAFVLQGTEDKPLVFENVRVYGGGASDGNAATYNFTTSSGSVGGLVGVAGNVQMEHVKASGFDVRATQITSGVGGLVGSTGISTLSSVRDIDLSDIRVTAEGRGPATIVAQYTGGAAGYYHGVMDGVTAKNITVEGRTFTGGILGALRGHNNGKLVNVTAEEITVTGYNNHTGGAVGLASSGIGNITVRNAAVSQAVGNYTGGIAGNMSNQMTHSLAENVAVTGSVQAGGAAGVCGSLMENVYVRNSTVTASVYAGGLVGSKSGNVLERSGAYNVDVRASGNYAGGLAGSMSGTIQNCFINNVVKEEREDGTVRAAKVEGGSGYVGGLAGYESVNATITGCYAKTDVESKNSHAGGLVGFFSNIDSETYSSALQETIYTAAKTKLTKCYYDGNVTAGKTDAAGAAGGIIGVTSIFHTKDKEVADGLAAQPDDIIIGDCTITAPNGRGDFLVGGSYAADERTLAFTPKEGLSFFLYEGARLVLGEGAAQETLEPAERYPDAVITTADAEAGADDSGADDSDSAADSGAGDSDSAAAADFGADGQAAETEEQIAGMGEKAGVQSVRIVTTEDLQDISDMEEVLGSSYTYAEDPDNPGKLLYYMPYRSGIVPEENRAMEAYVLIPGVTAPSEFTDFLQGSITKLGHPYAENPQVGAGEELTGMTAYPAGIDHVTFEFTRANPALRLTVADKDGKLLLDTPLADRAYSVSWDFSGDLTVTLAEESAEAAEKNDRTTAEESAQVTATELRRCVTAWNSHGYYILGDAVYNEKQEKVLEGRFVHLAEGKAMDGEGVIWDLETASKGEKVKTGRQTSVAVPVFRFQADGNTYETFAGFTRITDETGETTERDYLRFYYKDGEGYFVNATDDSVAADSVFCLESGGKSYQTVLRKSSLLDLRDESPLLGNSEFAEQNSGIAYTTSSFHTDEPYLLIAYKDGGIAGYNYLTGELLFQENGRGTIGILEYIGFGLGKLGDTHTEYASGIAISRNYRKASELAELLTENPGVLHSLLASEGGGDGTEIGEGALELLEGLLEEEGMTAGGESPTGGARVPSEEGAGGGASGAAQGAGTGLSGGASDGAQEAETGLSGGASSGAQEAETGLSDGTSGGTASDETVSGETGSSSANADTDTPAEGLALGRTETAAEEYIPVFNTESGAYEIYEKTALEDGMAEASVDENLKQKGIFIGDFAGYTDSSAKETEKADGMILYMLLAVVIFGAGLAFAAHRSKKDSEGR